MSDFSDLLGRVRRGDAEAAAELVRNYEREIRRAVRLKLTDPRLRRTLDSMDICQSVLANFFLRVSAGQFDFDGPEQLLRLLLTMARNKVIDKARREQADRRDRRLEHAAGGEELDRIAGRDRSPSEALAGRELIDAARGLMSEEERHILAERAAGRGWAELAAEAGKSPDAVRKQFERALDRVAGQLGVGE